jgi:hypothetical protein
LVIKEFSQALVAHAYLKNTQHKKGWQSGNSAWGWG